MSEVISKYFDAVVPVWVPIAVPVATAVGGYGVVAILGQDQRCLEPRVSRLATAVEHKYEWVSRVAPGAGMKLESAWRPKRHLCSIRHDLRVLDWSQDAKASAPGSLSVYQPIQELCPLDPF